MALIRSYMMLGTAFKIHRSFYEKATQPAHHRVIRKTKAIKSGVNNFARNYWRTFKIKRKCKNGGLIKFSRPFTKCESKVCRKRRRLRVSREKKERSSSSQVSYKGNKNFRSCKPCGVWC